MALTVPVDDIVARNSNGLLGKHASWERVRLGEVATIQNGAAFKSEYFNSDERGMPLLRIRDVLSDRTQVFYDGPYEDHMIVEPGDLVIGMDGDFKSSLWDGPRALLNQRVCRVSMNSDTMSLAFASLVLQGYLDAVNEVTSSVTVKHLSSRSIEALPLPCPSREEQDRIVSKINDLFHRLGGAASSTSRAKANLELQRAAIYSKAVEGSWPTIQLRELLREPLRNGHSARESRGKGLRTLTLTAVTTGCFIDSNTKLTSANADRVKDLWLEDGDIFIERSNTPELVGTAALFRGASGWAIFPDLLIRVRVGPTVLPEYLEFVLKERRARQYFRKAAQGIAGSMPKISQGTILGLQVPLPDIDDQDRIVSRANDQLSAIGGSLRDVGQIEKRRAQLSTAIIQKSLGGRLVPRDPSAALLGDRGVS